MGKSSVVYVIGLSMMIAIAMVNINRDSSSSMDTYTSYYSHTAAHNVALAGANIGTQLIIRTPTYSTDLVDQSFNGGRFDMRITAIGGGGKRVTSTSRISIGGTIVRDTVIAELRYTPFWKYGWFTESEVNGYKKPDGSNGPFSGQDDWKITGDSVYGYAHTNNHFNLAGRPYFHDKITATNAPALRTLAGDKNPIYNAGYEWGVTVNRPTSNLTNLEAAAQGSGALVDLNKDVALTFFSDGRVGVKIPPTTGATRNDTVSVNTLAPTGVFAVKNGDLRITGTYKGQLTVVALKGSQSNKGNVWIDGTGIKAASDPTANSGSTDMLGIVAERMAYISEDDTRGPASQVTIQGAIYCQNGELTAENFWQLGKHGRLYVTGSLVQKTAGSLGIFDSGGLKNGFYYSVRHDSRFLVTGPPMFPMSDKYELASWWEN